MKEIELTQSLTCLIDDGDFSIISAHKWYAKKHGNIFYAYTNLTDSNGKRFSMAMHRLLLNPSSLEQVDHKDRNGLNNCRSNIRICSRSENMINRVLKNSTGFRGVFLIRKTGRFTGAIQVGKKRIRVGCFKTAKEAAAAYNVKAKEMHGAFAVLNNLDI